MIAKRLVLLALLAAGSSGLPMARAHAQMSMGTGGPGGGGGGGGDAASDDDKKKPAPPSSIPGAVAVAPVVPAAKGGAELDPNAALFDSIDRGDIGAAREALSRGADLDARNVLGQRPIDVSIDLSRNDITFLLLSMRSQNGDQAPADTSADTAEADPDAPPTKSAQLAASTPVGRQFASTSHAAGGGAPQPSAGFLGFGGR